MTVPKINLKQKVYSFPRGGITFEDSSVPSRDTCVTAFLPSLSVIPLIQHSGGRSYPVVSVGEMVREGMLIGRGQGLGSANIHASVPGKVIRMVSWKNALGQFQDGLVIRMEGSFEKLGKREEIFSWEGMLPYDIQRTIADFGVVEMESGGKPVSDIISSLRSAPEPITLVVRCVFDDPWLAADYVLCRERARAIAEGAAITARTCRVSRIIFAISEGEHELGSGLLAAGGKWGIPTAVVLVGSRYPQRNRRELELVLRNYGKKEGVELGSLFVLGPATLASVFDAVKLRKPVMERYITVGGSAVKKPQVMKVRIGTRFREVFAECGGFTGVPRQIASGSPLLGQPILDLDEPVIKTSYALYALLEGSKLERQDNCINCGECRNVCPVGLDPEELYKRSLVDGKGDSARNNTPTRAAECHGCGCCDVVCPSRLPLSAAIVASALRGK
ncbi:MAG: SLBB domain-containing protein [Treponema sp.]|nr:SLBB domain-containing protein [Treponema sp.]